MDITFLPYGDTEKEQLVNEYLFFRPATIPVDTYRGQTEPFEGLDVGSMHFITSADVSDDLVYSVTKLLYENRELVVEKHAAGRAINPNKRRSRHRHRVSSWCDSFLSRNRDLDRLSVSESSTVGHRNSFTR